ncbi:MAG: hypothetical protein JST54_06080 [Deltaproteobacteria bacterium]|nr:hypothetical protein [Deltaproteobacteria bacterium]
MKEATSVNTDRLQDEIAALRTELGGAVEELDRRRKQLMDLPTQLKQHALPVAIAATVGVLALAGLAAFAIAQRREQQRPRAKIRRARKAARRAIDHPERVAGGEPSLPVRLVLSVLTAAAGAAARKIVERTLRPPPALSQGEALAQRAP